jgi:hypothetical protein
MNIFKWLQAGGLKDKSNTSETVKKIPIICADLA